MIKLEKEIDWKHIAIHNDGGRIAVKFSDNSNSKIIHVEDLSDSGQKAFKTLMTDILVKGFESKAKGSMKNIVTDTLIEKCYKKKEKKND